jgi:pyridoxal phosphate enzyme (YggS family)
MNTDGMDISENLRKLKSTVPGNVSIVAVSKRKSLEEIRIAYEAGQRIFGENRVQELTGKQSLLPADIRWHMVGHLQTNKVKYLAGFIDMIQSVDSLKLLQTIDREALRVNRVISCLLQIHIALEDTKFGFTAEEAMEMAGSGVLNSLPNVCIRGVMGMATYTSEMDRVRAEFRYLREIFRDLKEKCFASSPDFREISMGMTGDYHLAIEEGSTMIRIGTLIFGPRND